MAMIVKGLILSMVLAISQTLPPVPRKTPNATADSDDRVQKQSANEQSPTASLVLVNPTNPKVSQDAREQPANTNTGNPVVIREPITVTVGTTWWERFYVIFTGLLVIAAAVGAYFANRTLSTMQGQLWKMEEQLGLLKRQTEVIEEQTWILKGQTKLQEAAMRQWMVLKNWDCSIFHRDKDHPKLEVRVTLVNATKYPLKLLGCKGTLTGWSTVSEESAVSHTLVPDETFAVKFWTLITTEQAQQRDGEGLYIRLSGRVAFIDVLETRQDQTFSGILLCRGPHTYFTAEISDIKSQENEEGQATDS